MLDAGFSGVQRCKFWGAGALKRWGAASLGGWGAAVVACWDAGVLRCWDDAVLGCCSDAMPVLGCWGGGIKSLYRQSASILEQGQHDEAQCQHMGVVPAN